MKAIINTEEKITRVAGRRAPPSDSMMAAKQLLETGVALHKALNLRWCKPGIYRFKTHEEADAWMTKMLARSRMINP